MDINFYIPLPLFFIIVFVLGLYLGFKAHQYNLELDKAREEYEKNFNCFGIRKPPPGTPTPPKPMRPKK